MFVLLLLALHIYNVHTTNTITVFGDVYKDIEFFTRTFPWIIDNIGGDIKVEYYMQGSGRYTVPQMCTLAALRDNTFLQAQYLKCEAQGNPSEVCLCEAGIDQEQFKSCVHTEGSWAGESAAKFQSVGVDITPLIELGPKSTVFGVEDTWFLKKICTIFGDVLPRGCVKPFSCNGTEELMSRPAIAQFDRCCTYEECRRPNDITTTTSTTQLYTQPQVYADPYDETFP